MARTWTKELDYYDARALRNAIATLERLGILGDVIAKEERRIIYKIPQLTIITIGEDVRPKIPVQMIVEAH